MHKALKDTNRSIINMAHHDLFFSSVSNAALGETDKSVDCKHWFTPRAVPNRAQEPTDKYAGG